MPLGADAVTPKEASSSAALFPVAVSPGIDTNAVEGSPAAPSSKGADITVPLGKQSGYRFDLSNDSKSAMAPARMSASGLSFKQDAYGKRYGFIAESLIISKGLLDHADGLSLEVGTVDGQNVLLR